MPARLLLLGFEPFGGWPRNPAADAVRATSRLAELRRRGLATGILPVHRLRAPAALRRLLRRHRPEALVMVGVAAGRSVVGVERIGVNCYRPAGAAGVGRRIVPRGPDGLFATLPLRPAVASLRRAGLPAAISESAGTYLCNLVLYQALAWAAEEPSAWPARIGFVHVPATAQALPPGACMPCVDPARLADGLAGLARDVLTGMRSRGQRD